MKRLTSHELRKLERDHARGGLLSRALAELRQHRAGTTLAPDKLAALARARGLVADLDGDHGAELEALDEVLAAHGIYADQQEDPRAHETPDRGPTPARPRRGWPFGY